MKQVFQHSLMKKWKVQMKKKLKGEKPQQISDLYELYSETLVVVAVGSCGNYV